MRVSKMPLCPFVTPYLAPWASFRPALSSNGPHEAPEERPEQGRNVALLHPLGDGRARFCLCHLWDRGTYVYAVGTDEGIVFLQSPSDRSARVSGRPAIPPFQGGECCKASFG